MAETARTLQARLRLIYPSLRQYPPLHRRRLRQLPQPRRAPRVETLAEATGRVIDIAAFWRGWEDCSRGVPCARDADAEYRRGWRGGGASGNLHGGDRIEL